MSNWMQKLLSKVSRIESQQAHMIRPGTVEEVKEDKIRVNMGMGTDGKPIIGPWVHNGSHRAAGEEGYTERNVWRKGQSVMMFCPHGDHLQALVMPYSPTETHPPPNHAKAAGPDARTQQMGPLHITHYKEFYDCFLNEDQPEQQQQQQFDQMAGAPGQTDDDQAQPKKEAGPPIMGFRVYKNGAITGWVAKTDARFAVNDKGAKVRCGKHFCVATPGKLIVSEPPRIEDDPSPNDDMTKLPQTSSSSSGGTQ